MTPLDKDTLLDDVLWEKPLPGFEAGLLTETLRHAQKRRRNRQLRKVAALMLIVSFVTVTSWKLRPQLQQNLDAKTPAIATLPCPIFQTIPLPPSALVTSTAFTSMESIGSRTFVTVISTSDQPRLFRTIDDAQLLALAQPHSALLIRISPHEQALIFTNPASPPIQ